jgi:flagellar hook-associated protein 1
MPISTFLGLETALRGLLAEQRALDVTGHNVANASTIGYSRQAAVLTETPSYTDAPAGQIGTGVDVLTFQRIRDTFVDTQYRAQSSQQGAANALQDGLGQVELELGEPSDTGLNSLLSKYWAAWQDVANAPDNPATRQALVQTASTLSDAINSLATEFDTLASQNQTNVASTVSQVNALAKSIADLNAQINATETGGGTPNDLLDQRDALLDKLSQLTQISVTPPPSGSPDGAIKVAIGVAVGGSSNLIVDGDTQLGTLTDTQTAYTNTYAISTASGPQQVTFGDPGGIPYAGKLGGLQNVLDLLNDTTGYRSKLDAMAQQLAADTNAIHSGGADLSGAPVASTGYASFFVTSDGSGTVNALNLTVNPLLLADPAHVAAGSTTAGPGDGSVALAIASIRTAKPPAVSANVDDMYTSLVTTIGTDSQKATQNATVAGSLVDSLDSRRQSVSGVSLDEEMANLLKFQRGYQAAARALTAMDDMIDQLINRTGRSGL